MKKQLMALLFGTTLVLAACGGGGEEAPAEEPATEEEDAGGDEEADTSGESVAVGEEVYAQACASCHGDNLGGGAGPALTNIGSKMDADQIRDIIASGPGNMPPNAAEGAEADAVSEWLAQQK
ncbi:cytochrome c [Bacillaceae bacterium SIJ1]|uniref:cytochrome c551 n=1 Tax=Litoribacterium kuwaitense TaxID=1398745 RepID=UPI0013EB6F27|nr:cytochrome c [Litoribacterium kuwaitense]NGP44921.1 cytochrome c [Litoribacterium kuwaitense]